MVDTDVNSLLANLREMYFKVRNSPTEGLSDPQKEARVEQRAKLRSAIFRLENRTLQDISATLGEDAGKIQKKIDDLEDRMHGVTDTVGIIQIVGQAMSAISKIAAIV